MFNDGNMDYMVSKTKTEIKIVYNALFFHYFKSQWGLPSDVCSVSALNIETQNYRIPECNWKILEVF